MTNTHARARIQINYRKKTELFGKVIYCFQLRRMLHQSCMTNSVYYIGPELPRCRLRFALRVFSVSNDTGNAWDKHQQNKIGIYSHRTRQSKTLVINRVPIVCNRRHTVLTLNLMVRIYRQLKAFSIVTYPKFVLICLFFLHIFLLNKNMFLQTIFLRMIKYWASD